MNRLLPFAMAGSLIFLASASRARTVVVTDADSEKTVALARGDMLVVRLTANATTGYLWNLVCEPNGPLTLSGKPDYRAFPYRPGVVGSGGTQEFRFTVLRSEKFSGGGWLRFLSLRPFEPGVKDAKLWEIHYTVKAAK